MEAGEDARLPVPATGQKSGATDAAVLAGLVAASLFLTSSANRGAGAVLARSFPDAAWIASAAIPSCLVILVLFLSLADQSALRWRKLRPHDRAYVVRLTMGWLCIWLAGSIVAAFSLGRWITYAHGWSAVIAFLIFGPIGEELLFRGLIFERARRLWSGSAWPAVWLSTVAFSVHHAELHPHPLQGLTLVQIAFTVPMGIVFARLRERSGNLWPALLVHVATNLPAAF